MKNFYIAITAVTIMLILSGCGENNTASVLDSSLISSTVNSSTSSTVEGASSEENISDTSADTDAPNNEGADNSAFQYPDNRAGRMVNAALGAENWSYMDSINDQDTAGILVSGLVLDDCEEYCLAYCGMSGQMQYVFAIKPKAEKADTVKIVFDNFYNKIKNDPDLAFYPAEQEAANGAVQGESGGYLYLVVHANGQDCADVMTEAQ